MESPSLVRALRKYLKERRAAHMERYNSGLPDREYMKNVGRIVELDEFDSHISKLLKGEGNASEAGSGEED